VLVLALLLIPNGVLSVGERVMSHPVSCHSLSMTGLMTEKIYHLFIMSPMQQRTGNRKEDLIALSTNELLVELLQELRSVKRHTSRLEMLAIVAGIILALAEALSIFITILSKLPSR
jgi:hypothetical protein